MRRIISVIMVLLAMTTILKAHTLKVVEGSVTYLFPAATVGDVTFTNGTTLTAMGRQFALSDVTMSVSNDEVTAGTVDVVYNGSSAAVTIAGDVAQYVTVTIDGAHVTIDQSDALSNDLIKTGTANEISYTLSGASTDGSFNMSGSAKATVNLNGLDLTNPTGAPINITNGKRIEMSVKKDTENTLKDGVENAAKGALYCKGHLELKGKGTLNVYAYGSAAHGIKAGDYCSMKNCTVNVLAATKDGLSCNQFFLMESGTLTISGVGDDGIQCDLDGTESTGEIVADTEAGIKAHDDEDTGNIYLEGGSINISTTAIASKGIKAYGDIRVADGIYTITTSGNGTWDDDDQETKAGSCMSADGSITISGGTLNLTSTGSGGKGMKCDQNMTISGGTINVTTEGGLYYSNGSTENHNYTGNTDNLDSKYYSSPKGIKAGVSGSTASTMTITGGTINVTTKGTNGEGIECKGTLTIDDGTVYVFSASDDAINSASDMFLNGGSVTAVSNKNDGIDSNGNLTITGGIVIACGGGIPECGLDAAEQYHLYIKGGNVLAIGANNNSVTATTGSQCLVSTRSTSYTGGTTVSVTNGSTTLASFTIPEVYSPTSGGGGPGGVPGGQGGPGGQGFSILSSCGGMTTGSKYTLTIGATSASCTAATSFQGM